ncbi:MAG: hypothetical protein HYZ84_04665 [Candidatus Omnitrophica bacterium]|nr:hypothetical protein [Candidatus Omnitrophota bacterium]
MKNEFLKTLWMMRFQKMRKNEEEAAWKYAEILKQCLEDSGNEKLIIDSLHQLIQEERMHEKLAEELIQIVYRNHPEDGILSL